MARKYARTKLSINDDPDFEALSTEAQWLYQRVMLTDATLSACGVMDWRPKRLLRKSRTITLKKLLAAAAELERARFALFDLEYEEALVRTFIRHDEPLKNPKMAAPVINSYQAITSPELRAEVVTEVRREFEEHPEYSSWSHKDTAAELARMMKRPNSSQVAYTDAYSDFITDDDAMPIADRIGYSESPANTDLQSVENAYSNPVQNGYPDTYSDAVQIPDPDRSGTYLPTTNYHPPTNGGYVKGERHQSAEPDSIAPHPLGCPQHPNGTTESCHRCGEERKRREQFDKTAARLQTEQRVAERRRAAEDRARAITDCAMCDADGHLHDPAGDGISLCDHRRPSTSRPSLREQFEALRREQDPASVPERDEDEPPEIEERASA